MSKPIALSFNQVTTVIVSYTAIRWFKIYNEFFIRIYVFDARVVSLC